MPEGPSRVVILQWPAQQEDASRLSVLGVPRLLLIEPDADPPTSFDHLEDWIRLPVDERDLQARIRQLLARVDGGAGTPRLDHYGRLTYRGTWVALSPIEVQLAGALIERFGEVVPKVLLQRRIWPEGLPRESATYRVHLSKLRQRVRPLGLEIRSVSRHGAVMEPTRGSD